MQNEEERENNKDLSFEDQCHHCPQNIAVVAVGLVEYHQCCGLKEGINREKKEYLKAEKIPSTHY